LFEDPHLPNVFLLQKLLGAFAKLRKMTISFFMSVRLSGHVEQRGYH
jgi:hypothetical protein